MTASRLLESINSPADLRRLDRKQLPQLATELRAFLIEDCGLASGDCRSYQALTPVKALYEAVFVDGLEEPVP